MSEHPELPIFLDNGAADLTNGPGDEPTIPTAEILNVLEQLKAASQSESSQARTQSQSQSQSQSQDPPSQWTILHASLSEKPHDPDGWRRLVEIAETGRDVEQIKATYEALLTIYPNTVCLASHCSATCVNRPFLQVHQPLLEPRTISLCRKPLPTILGQVPRRRFVDTVPIVHPVRSSLFTSGTCCDRFWPWK
jgi:hypothetical protein